MFEKVEVWINFTRNMLAIGNHVDFECNDYKLAEQEFHFIHVHEQIDVCQKLDTSSKK